MQRLGKDSVPVINLYLALRDRRSRGVKERKSSLKGRFYSFQTACGAQSV